MRPTTCLKRLQQILLVEGFISEKCGISLLGQSLLVRVHGITTTVIKQATPIHMQAKCESWCQIHLSDGHLGYAWKTCSKKVGSMLQLISISARQLGQKN